MSTRSYAGLSRLVTNPFALWVGFVLAHVWLVWLGFVVVPGALGDVTGVYRFWVENAQHGVFIVGINTTWVYPILALAPIMFAAIAGINNYLMAWLVIVCIGDFIAFFYLVRGFSRPAPRALAAWWWTIVILALGPISLGRLDSITTPIAVWAILFVITRPRLAGVLMAIGAWIKVWPGALLVAAVLMVRTRWRILVAFAISSAVVIIAALIAGAGLNVFSFFGYQSSRGLQIESPAATPLMWLASAHAGIDVYFDTNLLTYQVRGPGVDAVASVMTWVMLIAVALTLWLIVRVTRRRIAPVAYLPAASLALVTSLMAFNKVGSPQYMVWMIPPIIAGLAIDRGRFGFVAALAVLTALLTQLVYPWTYENVVRLEPGALMFLTLRNLLELAIFVAALVLLARPRWQASARAARPLRRSQ